MKGNPINYKMYSKFFPKFQELLLSLELFSIYL